MNEYIYILHTFMIVYKFYYNQLDVAIHFKRFNSKVNKKNNHQSKELFSHPGKISKVTIFGRLSKNSYVLFVFTLMGLLRQGHFNININIQTYMYSRLFIYFITLISNYQFAKINLLFPVFFIYM